MKQIIFLVLLLVLFIIACNEKKVKQEKGSVINAKQLLLIIQDSSFSDFKKLVNATGYPLLDSGDTHNGSIIYNANESEETGNSLSATMSKDLHVNFLHFSTYNKGLLQRLKQQFIELGFKLLGSDDRMEEFEKGNIYITIIKVEDDLGESYDVMLVRKK